jgi:hypothetical protein
MARKKPPAFVSRAERAFARVVRKVRAENKKLGLPAVVWPNGKRAAKIGSTSLRPQMSKIYARPHFSSQVGYGSTPWGALLARLNEFPTERMEHRMK